MLIALWIQALVALLGLAANFQQVNCEEHFNDSVHDIFRRNHRGNRHRHSDKKEQFFHNRYYPYSHDIPLKFEPGEKLKLSENKLLVEYEFTKMLNSTTGVDCCPSVLEMIEPEGGRNDQGIFVELYKSDNYRQRFYELSCHEDVVNKPCRFMDKKIHAHSRCVQMYSYTYALVKDTPDHRNKNLPMFPGSGNYSYTLDYISVRSGCSCEVKPNPSWKKKKHKSNRRKRPVIISDEELVMPPGNERYKR
ncbi:hypothetical protein ABEB36_012553 [Hypothenemus hampei]|uniref:Spaetzle domain-containing protein n=1 Tax=Hypothenemus hampei TaxID=57062 RepID=A0ABD1ECA8_HYPHA